MLIACPYCQTEAKIAEGLEGSKVKCPQCRKTYLALEKPEKVETTLTPLNIVLAMLVVPAVGGFILYVSSRTSHDEPEAGAARAASAPEAGPAAATAAGATPVAPPAGEPAPGWTTEALDAVRELLGAAYAFDVGRASRALAAAGDPDGVRERAKRLVQDEGEFALAKWKPGALRILAQDGERSTVSAPLVSRADPALSCEVEFELAREQDRWKVASWKPVRGAPAVSAPATTPAPADARSAAASALKVDVEPRALEHLDSTPPEERRRIDELFARMVDFTLSPGENARASDALAEIGKPALPVLLNGFREQRAVDTEAVSRLILINQTMQRITDHTTVFAPRPELAEVEDLRLRSVKSWYEWWGYSGERFRTKPKLPDPFDAELEGKKKR